MIAREQVIACLPPFTPDTDLLLPPELMAYRHHYGLDADNLEALATTNAGLLRLAGYEIACQVFHPAEPRGTCYLAHGYFDHLGLYSHLIGFLLGRGYSVVGFDLPGHGLSSGPPGDIGSFLDYHAVLLGVIETGATLPRPWSAIGLSTGAAIIATYSLLNQGPTLDGQVLMSPLVRPRGWRPGQLAISLVGTLAHSVPRWYANTSGDKAFKAFLRADAAMQPDHLPLHWVRALADWQQWLASQPPREMPTLVLQGERDRTVAWRYNLDTMRRLFPHAQVHTYAHARHHLANETAAVRQAVFGDMDRFLAATPPPN